MKQFLLLPLAAMTLAPTAIAADTPESPRCEALKGAAKSVMLMHQRGIPEQDQVDSYQQILNQDDLNKAQENAYDNFQEGLRSTYDIEDADKAVEHFVARAYEQPRHDDEDDQDAAVEDFMQATHEQCMAAEDDG